MSTITEASGALRSKATEVRDHVTDTMQQSKDRVEVQIHRHPMESVLIAAGSGLVVGIVVGFLLGYRRD